MHFNTRKIISYLKNTVMFKKKRRGWDESKCENIWQICQPMRGLAFPPYLASI
jgi:hypothetical protein